MGAKDTVESECICARYDFEPFYSPWDVNNTKLNHCYECDASNEGREAQAEISFKAGIKEVVEWIRQINPYGGVLIICEEGWQAKLKEWNI